MGVDVASLALRVDALEVSAASRELQKFSTTAGQAEKSSRGLGGAAQFLTDNFKFFATSIAGVQLASFVKDSVVLQQRYQELGIAMRAVGQNAGISAQELDRQAEAVRKSGISMLESRGIITKLVVANIDLTNATKLARLAQDAAVVGQINSSEALNTLVHGITSAQTDVLKTIGINVSFERSYADLARQMGVTTAQLTEQQKTQARLNAVLGEASKLSGVYEASLANAGKQLRSTERLVEDLKVKVGALFDDSAKSAVSAYTEVLRELDDGITELTASGDLKNWSRQAAVELAFLSDVARNAVNIVGGLIAMTGAQLSNIKNLEFGKMSETFAQADKNLVAALQDSSKFQDAVNARIVQEDMLSAAITGQNNNIKEHTKKTEENTVARRDAKSAAQSFIESLQTEAREAGVTGTALTQLRAEYLGVGAAAAPYIQILKDVEARMIAQKDLQDSRNKQRQQGVTVTESLVTAEEKYAETQTRLIGLLQQGDIDAETFFRGIEKAGDEMSKTLAGANTDMKQLEFAIQGWGRRATDAIVDFAVTGKGSFSDFAQSVLKDILQMYVQMQLITPLLQSLPGLGFGAGGGGAAASTSAASSVFSGLFRGGRAGGGPVAGNSLYQVNERGVPELFQMGNKQFLLTPGQGGNVIPPSGGGRLSGGGRGSSVVVNLIESPGKGGETKQRETPSGVEIDVMVDQLVAKKTAERGSAINKGLRGNFGMSDLLVNR